MKFGLCCRIDEAEVALAAGYDYVELPLSGLADLDDLSPLRGLPIEATNIFFPPSIKLFGPGSAPYADYARGALEKAAGLGVQVSVLGSGAARTAPDDSGEFWEESFARIAGELSAIAAEFGITLAPESLNRSETNVGNSLSDLAERMRGHGVAYTADSYHVLYEWDADLKAGGSRTESGHFEIPWEREIPFLPAHSHLGDLPRKAARPDDPLLAGFVVRLKELGYDKRVSLEINRGSEHEALAGALADMRALFAI